MNDREDNPLFDSEGGENGLFGWRRRSLDNHEGREPSLYEVDVSGLEDHDKVALRQTPYLEDVIEDFEELSKLSSEADDLHSLRERSKWVGGLAVSALVAMTVVFATITAALAWVGAVTIELLGSTILALAVALVLSLIALAFALLAAHRRITVQGTYLRRAFDRYQARHFDRVLRDERREIVQHLNDGRFK